LKDHLLSAGPQAQSSFALNKVAVAAAFSALAVTASVLPVSAWALGLGKLNVQSALGEPLRAEIDVTSLSPDEGGSLQVRVASPETYRAAGVDYNQVLTATSIVLQRRTDGRPYLRIVSDRTVQEPFVDVILDLSWSSGRLVREYTLLFDPPSSRPAAQATSPVIDAPAQAPATAAVAEPAVKPAQSRPVASAASEPLKVRKGKKPAPAASEAAASAPVEAEQAAPQAKVAAPESSSASMAPSSADTVRVKAGDSLSRIAGRVAPQGVSLDQMLVGLYRNNPQAFLGNNMNRLKSGVVLNVPTAEQAKSVSNAEARQIIVAQSADFAAYRQHLAGAVTATTPEQPQRQAKGKVEAEVQDKKQAEAPTPDKLTLSKGGMSSQSKPAAEDRLAKTRAKQEEATRVAELSKNLDDLRKLKDKTAAASAPAKVVPAPAAVAPSKPAPAPVPAPAPAPVPSKPAVVAPPAPAPVPSAPAVVEPASAPASASVAEAVASAALEQASGTATSAVDQASAPEAVASSARPALPVPPAPIQEPESPGFLESLNPMLLAAGGAAVALLAGAIMYLRTRRRGDTGETSFLESRLQPDSFFGASGGQRVDTRDATGGPSSMSYSLSQLDAIGDVDPVAEADVYLAYGRDLQAEEILKEALRSTPDRLAVRTKLLEVYAKRRDTKGYEQLAVQLYNLTSGQGEDWAKAQEMGLGIDPENPLYQPGGQPSATPLSIETPNDMLGASTIPHSVMPTPTMLEPAAAPVPVVEVVAPAAAPAEDPAELIDLDLDISAPAPLDEVSDSVSPHTTEAGDLPPLELPEVENTVIEPKAPADSAMELPKIDAAAPADDGGLDFDLSMDTPAPAPAPAPASFDLSSISLDLDAPAPAPAAPADDWMADATTAAPTLAADPMTRKFELAEEFRQIGDVDGARELLQEVLENSQDAALKSKAQNMLDSLG